MLEIYRAQQRLHAVGENAGLVGPPAGVDLAAAQEQVRAQPFIGEAAAPRRPAPGC